MSNLLWVLAVVWVSSSALALDAASLVEPLRSPGLVGLVHGRLERGAVVFVYSNPEDFFDRRYMALIARDPKIRAQMETLRHNDRIRIKGVLARIEQEPLHVSVQAIEVLQSVAVPPQGAADLPPTQTEIASLQSMTALVHAVLPGEGLMIEYRDHLIPLAMSQQEFNAYAIGLYRGDLIEILPAPRKWPLRPFHLELRPTQTGAPLRVIESLVTRHDQEVVVSGRLALFSKGPTISRDVWAVEEALPGSLYRYFTLVNFTAEGGVSTEMEKISYRLKDQWSRARGNPIWTRSKWVHPNIRVEVRGQFHLVSPSQANAQIILNSNEIKILREGL